MRTKLMTAAALALAMGPSMGGASVIASPSRGGLGEWFKANGKSRWRGKSRCTRDASRLQLRGWPTIPCDAPEGYFWKRNLTGKMKHRLYKLPPGERHVTYDEANDRSLIRSGWGYVKPTYAPGDAR